MILDNEEEIINIRKTRNFIVGIFILLVAIGWFEFIPVTWYYAVGTLVFLFIIFMFYWLKQEFTYVRYSATDNYIEIRYYHIALKVKRNMIKLKPSLLAKYEIEQVNKRQYLILYQKTKTGLFKYPPINISLFKEEDRKKLKINLTKYASQNR